MGEVKFAAVVIAKINVIASYFDWFIAHFVSCDWPERLLKFSLRYSIENGCNAVFYIRDIIVSCNWPRHVRDLQHSAFLC